MKKELTFDQIKEYVGLHTKHPEQFKRGYYYYDDGGCLENFVIVFNIILHPSSDIVLETMEIDLHKVYEYFKLN